MNHYASLLKLLSHLSLSDFSEVALGLCVINLKGTISLTAHVGFYDKMVADPQTASG